MSAMMAFGAVVSFGLIILIQGCLQQAEPTTPPVIEIQPTTAAPPVELTPIVGDTATEPADTPVPAPTLIVGIEELFNRAVELDALVQAVDTLIIPSQGQPLPTDACPYVIEALLRSCTRYIVGQADVIIFDEYENATEGPLTLRIYDLDSNGRPEVLHWDVNRDGIIDIAEYDTDNDTAFEFLKLDLNNDGILAENEGYMQGGFEGEWLPLGHTNAFGYSLPFPY
jgi:hypothetical protein